MNKNDIITLIVLASSVGIASFSANIAFKNSSLEYRPYVNPFEVRIVDTTSETVEIQVELINDGKIAANNVTVQLGLLTNGEEKDTATFTDGFILPSNRLFRFISITTKEGKENLFDILLANGNELGVMVSIQYDGIKSQGHETYVKYKYDKEHKDFTLIEGEAK